MSPEQTAQGAVLIANYSGYYSLICLSKSRRNSPPSPTCALLFISVTSRLFGAFKLRPLPSIGSAETLLSVPKIQSRYLLQLQYDHDDDLEAQWRRRTPSYAANAY
jgi:hypothetical protein